jgi:hypothetical protein
MARLWERARRILSQQGGTGKHEALTAVLHRSAEGIGELALHLGEAAVNDLDCVFA